MKTHSSALTVLAVVCCLVASSTHGAMLGHYRLGDADTNPVAGADITESVNSSSYPFGYPSLLPKDVDPPETPEYSNVVPGTSIYDPLSDATVANEWSLHSSGDPAAARERIRTAGYVNIPSAFSFETFACFGEQSTASLYGYFGNHSKNDYGGWLMRRMDDGTITATLNSNPSALGGVDVQLVIQSTETIPLGEWHHFGLIFEGNSLDGSTDTHLYIDYQEVASGNFDDSAVFGDTSHGAYFYAGEWYRNGILWADEERYFDTALALDGSDFLRASGSPEPIPGDTNNDMKVNHIDAQTLASNWGQYGETLDYHHGDFNGDNYVNMADASIMAANWGDHTGVLEGVPQAVPEPGAIALMLVGFTMLAVRRAKF